MKFYTIHDKVYGSPRNCHDLKAHKSLGSTTEFKDRVQRQNLATKSNDRVRRQSATTESNDRI